jgi:RNA polymerase sigma-70 factor (ECF subfamily)
MHDHAPPSEDPESATSKEVVEQLAGNHRAFLRYVERRVGDRALAEEIVQEAFVRSLERGHEIRDSVLGWFYRVLRNAVIDHQRRQAVANRRLDAFAAELQSTTAGDKELTNVVCACVSQLAGTLKPEYADARRRNVIARPFRAVLGCGRSDSLNPKCAAVAPAPRCAASGRAR